MYAGRYFQPVVAQGIGFGYRGANAHRCIREGNTGIFFHDGAHHRVPSTPHQAAGQGNNGSNQEKNQHQAPYAPTHILFLLLASNKTATPELQDPP